MTGITHTKIYRLSAFTFTGKLSNNLDQDVGYVKILMNVMRSFYFYLVVFY